MAKDISYCAELLSDYEKDDFFLSLFAPTHKRDDILVILAFNHELAKTSSVVKEPMMGKIRLQWWRDEIAKIYAGNTPAPQPVLQSFVEMKEMLDKATLLHLIDFYDDHLVLVGFQRTEDLKNYLIKKYGVIFDIIETILGARSDNKDLSLGWGLTEFIRQTSFDIADGKHFIPIEILMKHGLDKGYITPKTEALKSVVKELHDMAVDALNKVNNKNYLTLYKSLAKVYLKEIAQKEFDIFQVNPEIRPAFAELKIMVKAFLLKFKRRF